MRRILFALLTLLAAALFVSPELRADVASRLCPSAEGGCLISDGIDLCLDTNRNGIACETGDVNLTMNAPTTPGGTETVQGDLNVDGDLTVIGAMSQKNFLSPVLGMRNGTLATSPFNSAANSCTVSTLNTGVSCGSPSAFAEQPTAFDRQIFVKTLTCAWAKITTWDATDSLTMCLSEETGAASTCVTGSSFTISTASPTRDVFELVVNANTANTSNYSIALKTTAHDDTTGPGSEFLSLSCNFTYAIP